MKKLLLILSACGIGFSAYGQKADSTIMGPGYTNNVYYSMANGSVKSSANTNWHLAFSVQPSQFPYNTLQGTTIRVNSARGITVYRVPGKTIADFATIDTTGMSAWAPLIDSDTSWDYGALNEGLDMTKLPPFGPDYGWGSYNSTSKNVETDSSVFVIKGSGFMRKFFINRLDFDTTWYFTHAHLNNDSLTNVSLRKQDYSNRLFAYYSFIDNSFSDLEPAKTTWDVVFTRYAANLGGQPYPVTGVLQNKGVTVAKAAKVDVNTVSETSYTGQYKTAINTIGYDWKFFDMANSVYVVEDSTVYFINTGGHKYKVVFTAFDYTQGKSVFNVTDLNPTSVKEISQELYAEVYPNPASGLVNIQVPFASGDTHVTLYNLNGQSVAQASMNGSGQLQLGSLGIQPGLYLLKLENGRSVNTIKLVIQ